MGPGRELPGTIGVLEVLADASLLIGAMLKLGARFLGMYEAE